MVRTPPFKKGFAMLYKLKNVIYFPSFNIIGGVETFCYEMALKYGKDYDITVLYRWGDPQQMEHISKVARTICFKDGDRVECDVFIFGWGWDILDSVDAKKYIQTFHADYINRKLNPSPSPKITHRFGVAENTTKGIREHFDWAKDIQTMYNPFTPKKYKRVLRLVSATRLTPEKGFDRMKILCEAFDKAGIPFIWLVFTDQPKPSPHPNMLILPCKVEGVLDYIGGFADAVVQLSNTEGFSYTIVEALSCGTPVVATDFAVAREQGIEDGKTGWILPMDMSRIPVEEIYKGLPKFKWTPPESHYEKVLAKGKSTWEKELKKMVKVRAKMRFIDLRCDNKLRENGEEWECTFARCLDLQNKGIAEMVEEDGSNAV